jgi:hypothetical protein
MTLQVLNNVLITRTGQQHSFMMEVVRPAIGSRTSLIITLCYYDWRTYAAGRPGVVNDLDVRIEGPLQGGSQTFLPNGLTAPDTENTVEKVWSGCVLAESCLEFCSLRYIITQRHILNAQIVIANPKPGTYRLTVAATRMFIAATTQRYSIAVLGSVSSTIVSRFNPASGVDPEPPEPPAPPTPPPVTALVVSPSLLANITNSAPPLASELASTELHATVAPILDDAATPSLPGSSELGNRNPAASDSPRAASSGDWEDGSSPPPLSSFQPREDDSSPLSPTPYPLGTQPDTIPPTDSENDPASHAGFDASHLLQGTLGNDMATSIPSSQKALDESMSAEASASQSAMFLLVVLLLAALQCALA